jgi:anti-anti-sigma regulatory factor
MSKVILPDVMDKASLPELAATLAVTLAKAKALVIDGEQAGRIGLSAVQLLASAARTAANSGASFAIERPSAELRAAVRFAGISDLLGLADTSGAAA